MHASKSLPFLLLLFVLTACKFGAEKPENLTVVKVDHFELKSKPFAEQLAFHLKGFDALTAKDPKNIATVKQKIIDDFILQSITESWAEENKMSVTEEELKEAIQKFRKQYPNDDAFRRNLASEHMSFNHWKKFIHQSLLQKKVLAYLTRDLPEPGEKEMKEFYDNNSALFQRRKEVKVQQIVTDRKEKAALIMKKLRRGASFDELSQYSNSPEKMNNGKTDWIDIETLDIFKKAYKLPVGARTSILKSPFGFHIMKVIAKRGSSKNSFIAAKPQIKKLVLENKEQELYSEWLDKQLRKSKIYKDPQVIAAITVHTKEE